MEVLRKYGYDILVNHFEPFLRNFIVNIVLLKNYKDNWKKQIPKHIVRRLIKERKINFSKVKIHEFFQQLFFSDLKSILIFSENYEKSEDLIKDLEKNMFILLMNELNRIRRKVAHVKENFSQIDLDNIKNDIRSICRGKASVSMIVFIDNEKYIENVNLKSIKIVDQGDKCKNNLPAADYDLDGGFVGRNKEINEIIEKIYSDLDRIITINGAGGVGKTALALELTKSILDDPDNPFEAIIWFSAKEERLTEIEIVPIEPDIKDLEQLINDILEIIDKNAFENYQQVNVPIEYCVEFLYKRFREHKYLLIIDNLETILEKEHLIRFIEDVPCKVLITSRMGLGRLERPVTLKELDESDALLLFKYVVKARDIQDLINLNDKKIVKLVNKVKRYPLAIKWSIGKYLLGQKVEEAFPNNLPGDSLIAKFSFEHIFSLLSENDKLVLYSIIVWNESVSKEMLRYLTELDDEDLDTAIRNLMLTSFIYLVDFNTKYAILSLTSGFINIKLDENKKIRVILQNRKYYLSKLIEGEEKLRSSRYSLIDSLGIKTPEEKIAFDYIKKAKEFFLIKNNLNESEKLFETAVSISPDLGYVYEEFSKFEFYRKKDHNKAIQLAKKSIEVEPENFHLWLNYGIMLRKTNQVKEAILILKKALELNPKYITTAYQLARAYTFIGDYKKADELLEQAQNKSKLRNQRLYIISSTIRIDNYIRWAKEHLFNKNYDKAINLLNYAEGYANDIINIDPNDDYIHYFTRELHYTYGLIYETKGESDNALKSFENAVAEIANKRDIGNRKNLFARSFYRIAKLKEKIGVFNIQEIIDFIDKGLADCKKDSKIYKKLKKFKVQTFKLDKERLIGKIIYFNPDEAYGFIKSKEEEYFFHISDFIERINSSSLIDSKGKKVSFNVLKKHENGKKDIAVKIDLI